MRSFKIIKYIDTTECGPESVIGNDSEEFQEVFLNQGSLDGACGPYSLFMALLVLGLLNRDDITNFRTDGRTKYGKIIKDLDNYSSLFRDGTTVNDLKSLLDKHFKKEIKTSVEVGKNREVIRFAKINLDSNNPTIVGVNFKEGAHWMLAIGYEELNGEIVRLLCLDPSNTITNYCPWNAIIEVQKSQSGIYPYKWWGQDETFVEYHEALSIELI